MLSLVPEQIVTVVFLRVRLDLLKKIGYDSNSNYDTVVTSNYM